jgi:hypothetical protein
MQEVTIETVSEYVERLGKSTVDTVPSIAGNDAIAASYLKLLVSKLTYRFWQRNEN